MNPPRKLPWRAECPDTWGSDRDHPAAPGNDHTQKRTGDKTSLKDAITRVALLEKKAILEKCSFSAEARRGAGHRTLLVWLSAGRWSFSLARRDHRCCAVTPTLISQNTLLWKGRAVASTTTARLRSERMNKCGAPAASYTHGVISGSWMQWSHASVHWLV